MAIQLLGLDGTTIASIDPQHKAVQTSSRPLESLAWISVGAPSGALTGVTANLPIFSFRNISANLIAVRRVGVGFITTTIFTTAQIIDFGLIVARAFTVSDSGGTAIALTGSNGKNRTSLGSLTSVDCRISTTANISAGTKTLDANHLAQIGTWSGAAGTQLTPALDNLLSQGSASYPLILAQNEGFNIMNITAMGAAGVIRAYVNIELAEAGSY